MHTILTHQGWRVSSRALLAITLATSPLALAPTAVAAAQNQTPASAARAAADAPTEVKVFHLSNAVNQNDANEVLIALRNILYPSAKMFLVTWQNSIVVEAPSSQLALAQDLVAKLDRPRKTYRLTFTIATVEDGKRTNVRRLSMTAAAGQRTVLKQGRKVPVVTGSYNVESQASHSENTYLDVGMNLDATLNEAGSGLLLHSKIERSSLASETSGLGTQDPIVEQTVLDGSSLITPGKPFKLGSLDIPGTAQHLEIEAIAEPIS